MLTALQLVCILVVNPAQPPFQPGPWGALPPDGNPNNPYSAPNFKNRDTWGVVGSIKKNEITLYRPAYEVINLVHDPFTGDLLDARKRSTTESVPSKVFQLGEDLTLGGSRKGAAPKRSYRIRDVMIGDRVYIEYDRNDGVDVCTTISIARREGGLVPPAPLEKPDAWLKHHEMCNADQAWEESQTPYPRKYWPSFRSPVDGKLYVAPYPAESTIIVLVRTMAPPPRPK